MNGYQVLVLIPLLVGLAHSLSWDIIVGEGKLLKFYNNGQLTRMENIPSAVEIRSVIYDPVDFRVFFTDRQDTKVSISSYDVITGDVKRMITSHQGVMYANLAYDPVNQKLFWCEDERIRSISLNDSSMELLLTLDGYCRALAVDSCGGYIYWVSDHKIERAAFDGSQREVLLDANVKWRRSLIIDPQTQKMFWIDAISKSNKYTIEMSDLNGKNRRTFYSLGDEYEATGLAVSNDYLYWKSYSQEAILRLPKREPRSLAITFYASHSIISWQFPTIAANYTIEDQASGTKSCEALKSLIHNSTANSSRDAELQCSTCHNYCINGNCTISAGGSPNCSCEAGYKGKRCEVDACYMYCSHGGVCSLNEKGEPVCLCTVGYEGQQCDITSITTTVQPEDTNQVNIEDLKRALQFFTDKVDDYEANIEKNESQ